MKFTFGVSGGSGYVSGWPGAQAARDLYRSTGTNGVHHNHPHPSVNVFKDVLCIQCSVFMPVYV